MNDISPSRRRKLRTFNQGKLPTEFISINNQGRSKKLLDLASNDYLGLKTHPALIKAAKASMDTDGVGAGASRLITGSRHIHYELEKGLAEWLGREKVLLFPSGFQANIAGVMALANRNSTVLVDRLIHYSLLVGVKAAGAKLQRFAHNDLEDLEDRLKQLRKREPTQSPVVITESLFSMEGTSPPLMDMSLICEQHGAKLLVDEAHALGILGPQGKGLSHGISTSNTIISGTFGKAFGSGGAFLATDAGLQDHLLQTSGAFRYTTALAPPLTAAALAALKLISANPLWGEKLQERSNDWRNGLAANGWIRPKGFGPILSLLIGPDQEALDLQNQLELSGLLSVAIRPPTVPEGTSRLRIVLRRDLPEGTLQKLLNCLGKK